MSKVLEAVHNHHQKMLKTYTDLAESIAKRGSQPDALALVDFLKRDLLPHAAGEESHLYPLVAQLLKTYGDGTQTMREDHGFIRNYVSRLEAATHAMASASSAERLILDEQIQRLVIQLQAILQLHMEKEERVYLPLIERFAPAEQQHHTLEEMHAAYNEEKGKSHTGQAAQSAKLGPNGGRSGSAT